jgi:transposase
MNDAIERVPWAERGTVKKELELQVRTQGLYSCGTIFAANVETWSENSSRADWRWTKTSNNAQTDW